MNCVLIIMNYIPGVKGNQRGLAGAWQGVGRGFRGGSVRFTPRNPLGTPSEGPRKALGRPSEPPMKYDQMMVTI